MTPRRYVVRRDVDMGAGRPPLAQWIGAAGYRVMVFGRLDKRHSRTPTLTRDRAAAVRFARRADAQAQVDRYYGWIKTQFTVEPE